MRSVGSFGRALKSVVALMMTTHIYKDITLVFLITAAFDVALNLLPPPVGNTLLGDYFSKHTVLAAALLAGFIATFTLPVIKLFTDTSYPTVHAVGAIFAVSALIGFPMQWSGAFPHLNTHYYEKPGLPRYQTFLADGLSGVMVASVYWLAMRRYTSQTSRSVGLMWMSVFLAYLALVRTGLIVYRVSPAEPGP